MSEISRENSAGAPDLPPAIFFSAIFFKCDLGFATAEGSAFFFLRDFFYLRNRVFLMDSVDSAWRSIFRVPKSELESSLVRASRMSRSAASSSSSDGAQAVLVALL